MRKLSVTTTYREKLWGWIYLVLQLFILPVIIVAANTYLDLGLREAELNFMLFATNIVVVAVIFHSFILRNSKIALSKPLAVIGTALAGFFFYIVSNSVISAGIYYIDPEFFNVNDSYISTMVATDFPLMLIGTVLFVPITEEVLYRGLIFAGLYNRNRFLAYLASTLFFASLHIIGYIQSYSPLQLGLCLLQYLPAGICFGWAYAKTDSIWTPILIHMINNTIAVFTMR